MKNRSILSLLLAASMLLAACTTTTSPTTTPTDVVPEGTPTAEESALVRPDPAASRFGTNLRCDLLEDGLNRAECENRRDEIIGEMLESEVVSRFDLARCERLESQIGTRCQDVISESGVQGPVSDEELATFQNALIGSFTDPASAINPSNEPAADASLCDELTTTGYAQYCRTEISRRTEQLLFDEIVVSGNGSRCSELSGELVDECNLLLTDTQPPEPADLAPASSVDAEGAAAVAPTPPGATTVEPTADEV